MCTRQTKLVMCSRPVPELHQRLLIDGIDIRPKSFSDDMHLILWLIMSFIPYEFPLNDFLYEKNSFKIPLFKKNALKIPSFVLMRAGRPAFVYLITYKVCAMFVCVFVCIVCVYWNWTHIFVICCKFDNMFTQSENSSACITSNPFMWQNLHGMF